MLGSPPREPHDPPTGQTGSIGEATALGASADEANSPPRRLALLVLSLAGALGLLLLFLAVVSIHRVRLPFLATVPIRLPGIAGGLAVRRGPIAVAAVVVVLNSIFIGILIAQLGR